MATPRKSLLSSSIAFALAVGGSITTLQASAQEAADSAADENLEIISISRKRPESLQEVPIAVTALSEKTIESAGIERPADAIRRQGEGALSQQDRDNCLSPRGTLCRLLWRSDGAPRWSSRPWRPSAPSRSRATAESRSSWGTGRRREALA